MELKTPLYSLKRQAKHLARNTNIPLHAALDRIAQDNGFARWSLLVASRDPSTDPAHGLYTALSHGDVVLIAGRPGQGKTLLALETCAIARQNDVPAWVFTLDLTEPDLDQRLIDLGYAPQTLGLHLDTTDTICADHIIDALTGARPGTIAAIDYIQLLDRHRDTPPLGPQMAALRAFADRSGVILLCLSQIARRFETKAQDLPGWDDILQPNPLDQHQFTKTVFLGATTAQIRAVA